MKNHDFHEIPALCVGLGRRKVLCEWERTVEGPPKKYTFLKKSALFQKSALFPKPLNYHDMYRQGGGK